MSGPRHSPTTIEEANRQAKARRLADSIITHAPEQMGYVELGDRIAKWSDIEWAHAAHVLGEKAPTAATRQATVSILRTRGRHSRHPSNVFGGLPS